jgi:hypothetical protein
LFYSTENRFDPDEAAARLGENISQTRESARLLRGSNPSALLPKEFYHQDVILVTAAVLLLRP